MNANGITWKRIAAEALPFLALWAAYFAFGLWLRQQIPLEALNQLSEINAANPESIVIYTAKAVQIRLGNLEDLERKARLIDDFLQDQRTSPYTVEYVDFSYEVPVIRLKDMPLEDKLTEGKGI